VQSPLSQNEHAAIARYLSGIKKQLQDVSDLFRTRYGQGSRITEGALRTLASIACLEQDFELLEKPQEEVLAAAEEVVSSRSN
jgi:hypothetical protein